MLCSDDSLVSLPVLFSQERRSSISHSFMLELTCRKGKVEGDRESKDEFSSKENRFFAVFLPLFFNCSTSLSGEEYLYVSPVRDTGLT